MWGMQREVWISLYQTVAGIKVKILSPDLLITPYPAGLLHWHCGYRTIVPVSQPHLDIHINPPNELIKWLNYKTKTYTSSYFGYILRRTEVCRNFFHWVSFIMCQAPLHISFALTLSLLSDVISSHLHVDCFDNNSGFNSCNLKDLYPFTINMTCSLRYVSWSDESMYHGRMKGDYSMKCGSVSHMCFADYDGMEIKRNQ